MSPSTVLVSIIGVLIASATALSVAYMHRKQMRQIEAFRADVKVGLVPKETWLWARFKDNWHRLLVLSASLWLTLRFLTRTGVPTRSEVVMVVFSGSCVAFTFALGLSQGLARSMSRNLFDLIVELRRNAPRG